MKLSRRWSCREEMPRSINTVCKGEGKEGWSVLLPILNFTCSYLTYWYSRKQSHLFYFPTQIWEFSLLRRPPGEERAGQKRVAKHWNRVPSELCGIPVLGDLQNVPGQGPEQPRIALKLAMLWGGHWIRWHPESSVTGWFFFLILGNLELSCSKKRCFCLNLET